MSLSFREHKYSVLKLIEAVKIRPVLWDSSRAEFRSHKNKDKVWQEVFEELEDNYRFLSQKEKSEFAIKITNKWRYLRDVFIRSIKKRATDTKIKKYMYHDRLSFMLKLYKSYIRPESPDLIQSDENYNRNLKPCYEYRAQRSISFDTVPESPHSLHEKPKNFDSNNEEESFSVKTEPEDEGDEEDNGIEEVRNGGTEECSSSNDIVNEFDDDTNADRASCSGKQVEEIEKNISQLQNREDIKPLDLEFSHSGSGRNSSDDEAFFISVLPTLGDMSLDEKLEFRIAVLQKISDIRTKRLNS